MGGGHGILGPMIDDIAKWAYRVRSSCLSGIWHWSTSTHRTELNSEDITSVRWREYGLHKICFRREYRRSTYRTRLIGCQPRVDVSSMKCVGVDRKQSKLIVRLKLGETHGVTTGREWVVAPERVESEERQRIVQRQVFWRHASTREAKVRVGRWGQSVSHRSA